MIVLTRASPTDSRLVRKLLHTGHYAAPPKLRQIPPKTWLGRRYEWTFFLLWCNFQKPVIVWTRSLIVCCTASLVIRCLQVIIPISRLYYPCLNAIICLQIQCTCTFLFILTDFRNIYCSSCAKFPSDSCVTFPWPYAWPRVHLQWHSSRNSWMSGVAAT